jgi:hypothetical protein
MANTAIPHNIAVIGRRLNDLYVLDASEGDSWNRLYTTALAAGRVDDDMALRFIGGMSETLIVIEDRAPAH